MHDLELQSPFSRSQLLELAVPRIHAFVGEMQAASKPDTLKSFSDTVDAFIDCRLRQMADTASFLVRQFDIGLHADPAAGATTTNTINIHSADRAVIQQGTVSSQINSTINASEIVAAVSALEHFLGSFETESDIGRQLKADVATIKAQLSAPKPSEGILGGVSKSLRSILEGAIGGVFSPQLAQLISRLVGVLPR